MRLEIGQELAEARAEAAAVSAALAELCKRAEWEREQAARDMASVEGEVSALRVALSAAVAFAAEAALPQAISPKVGFRQCIRSRRDWGFL